MLSLYQPRRMIIILNTIRLPAVDWSPGILLAHHFIEPTPTSPMNNDDCILPNDTSPNSVSEVMATWGLRRLWTGVAWKGSAGRGYLEIAGVQMTLGKTSATMTMKLITASFALINGTIPFSFFIDIHNLVLHNIRSTTPEIYNPLYQVLLLHLLTTKIKPSYLHLYFIKSHKPITSNQQNPKEKKKKKKMDSITISPTKPNLTTNDSAVLQALFDAESSPSNGITINPSLPPFPAHLNIDPTLHETLKAREITIVRTLASPNPTPETIQSAIDQLSTLITEHPTYPPAYVNRAQALRMLISTHNGGQAEETETDLFTPQNAETVSSLLSDLGEAIGLATPRSPADPVSEVQARLLADAHTHRGYLLLRLAKVKKSGEAFEGTGRWSQLDADRLEEMASRDFFFGGRFGNKVAQQLAVQTNPYAKMCGAIVKEALRKEVEG